jgi:hypothetical protein
LVLFLKRKYCEFSEIQTRKVCFKTIQIVWETWFFFCFFCKTKQMWTLFCPVMKLRSFPYIIHTFVLNIVNNVLIIVSKQLESRLLLRQKKLIWEIIFNFFFNLDQNFVHIFVAFLRRYKFYSSYEHFISVWTQKLEKNCKSFFSNKSVLNEYETV